MQARFVRLHWENDACTIATLYFKPDKPYHFTAGQYADFGIAHVQADSRGLSRTMTIVTSPSDKLIGFTTKFGRGASTYKQALLRLMPGGSVTVTDPMGDLVLPLDESIPLIFVAGGVAIASYVSMVRWLREQNDKRSITLLYAVRNRTDIIFQPDFDDYAAVGHLKKVLFTTDSAIVPDSWHGEIRQRRLTSRDIMRHVSADSQIYLSGAEPMVEQLRRELEHKHKIEQYRIAFDYYDGYANTEV